MASKEIALPHIVTFSNGSTRPTFHLYVSQPPPKNTLDPRWETCTDHRTACDCREAIFAEDLAELRAERDMLLGTLREELAGHATRAYTSDGARDEQAECKCIGCGIARRLPWYSVGGYVVTTRRSVTDTP
ncbi:hypothetical protein [Nonomuraea wenchangensis]|uniref:Uncharacterized protein n=1 Tax=Nonomuraea wenchangensis TaxID=568860 RepID=A0A1I0LTN8_9ACTN|nr:hypothetical protein [Nonomuraea wenchangensis]SEU46388.1 hypothetical protein SAMN05421811_12720 [Nonomuraea wenchangensis]